MLRHFCGFALANKGVRLPGHPGSNAICKTAQPPPSRARKAIWVNRARSIFRALADRVFFKRNLFDLSIHASMDGHCIPALDEAQSVQVYRKVAPPNRYDVDSDTGLEVVRCAAEDVLFGREVEADGRCPMKIGDGPANAPKGATVQRRPSAVRPGLCLSGRHLGCAGGGYGCWLASRGGQTAAAATSHKAQHVLETWGVSGEGV